MISSLLTLAVSAFSPDGLSAPDLFSRLDKDADGKVTQSEMTGSQQSMFKRALRVADGNEDGALNKDEFAKAVSDPKPVELPGANVADRMASFDVSRLDRNGDGNVSLDEVPGPMRDRFEQLLDRIGQDSVPVDKVQAYLLGERPGTQPTTGKSEEMMDADKDRMEKDDPKIELKSKSGKPGADKPSTAKSEARKSGDRKKNPNSPMENASPAAMFRQLDRNSDGRLTGNEIPPRMQENIKAADTDNDGSISQSEMQAALQRRLQNQKK
jgi:Ca2+-binding EF-hand superfamily protein